MKKEKHVISSTHQDSQGYKIMKSALESMLPQLNGKRKPKLGLEHVRIFPPLGVISNGEISQGKDGYYYLTAEMLYYDEREYVLLDNGTKLVKECFSELEHPFIECEETEVTELSVATDPANFERINSHKDLYDSVRSEVDLDFSTSEFGRKSELSDPEVVIKITTIIATSLGIIKSKVTEKLGDAVGEDLAKFYRLISKLAVETIKRTIPSNRPKNFVISYPNSKCTIELIVTTHKADKVLNSLQSEKLEVIANKIEQLKNLNPEKIQFIYDQNNSWEFNYLLSKTGAVIGTEKIFKKRDEAYSEILKKQKKK